MPWEGVGGKTWRLSDALSGATYDREGDEMQSSGLYVELGPWNCNFFRCDFPLAKVELKKPRLELAASRS